MIWQRSVPADATCRASWPRWPGGVEELDLLHVDHELVVVLVDEIDEQLTEPRGRVYVNLALDIDDLDAVLVVVTQLQIHKSSSAMHGVISSSRFRRGGSLAEPRA